MTETNRDFASPEEKHFDVGVFKIGARIVEVTAENSTSARIELREKYPNWFAFQQVKLGEKRFKFLLFRRREK